MTLPKIFVFVLLLGATACTVEETNVRGPGQSYPIEPEKSSVYGSILTLPAYEYPDTASSQVTPTEDTTQNPDVGGLQLEDTGNP